MKLIDNKSEKLGDDLKKMLKKGDRLKVVAACFSMYAYQELKSQLSQIDEFDFIVTNPTFIREKKKEKQERWFEINNYKREKSLMGSEFEINLKNKLNGKAIAKECAKWIKKKATFKSNINNNKIQKFINIDDRITYIGINEFSSVGLGYQKDNTIFNPITRIDEGEFVKKYLKDFDGMWKNKDILKDVTGDVIEYIANLYKENSLEFI